MARTPAEREVVQKALNRAHAPLTAKELAQHVPGVHAATVYRALKHLVQSGVAHEVRLGRAVRYESAHAPHHHHVVCTSCGTFEDVHYEPRNLDKETLRHTRSFAAITHHALNFYGICNKCQ